MMLQTKAVPVPVFVEKKFKMELSMSNSFTFIDVSYAFQAPSLSSLNLNGLASCVPACVSLFELSH